MGNSKSVVNLVLETDKNYYVPGEVVQGNVYINSPKPYPCSKIIMRIEGNESSWWKGEAQQVRPNQQMHEKGKAENKGGAKIIDANFILCSWNSQAYLHGQYAFPFVFVLPSHIPGSYTEKKSEYRGEISYYIRCVCISPKKGSSHVEKMQEVVVREPQRSMEEMLYGQLLLYPKSCLFRTHGVSRVACYFEKNYYMPGEDCVAICEVDNFKCSLRMRVVVCEFVKVLTLTTNQGVEKKITQVINSISFPGIEAHGQYTQGDAQKLPLPLKYKNNQKIHPSTSGRYVRCEYIIQVTPIFDGFCVGNTETFAVKLNILQEGMMMPKIEAPSDWNPEIYKKSEIILNYRQNNELYDSMIEQH